MKSRSRLSKGVSPDTRCTLLVTPWDPRTPGGVTTAVTNLHDSIATIRGWTACLLVNSWDNRRPVESGVDGRSVVYAQIRAPHAKGARVQAMILFWLWFPMAAIRWRRFISRNRIELINVHYPDESAFFWALMKRLRLFRGAVVLSFHGADIAEIVGGRKPGTRLLWHLIANYCTALTACSRTLAEDLRSLFPAVCGKTHVVMNGVDALRIVAEAAGTPSDDVRPRSRYIACISGFERKKGLDVLLDAFSSVAREDPNIHLVLICRAGPDIQGVRARLSEPPYLERVTMLVNCPHDKAMSVLAAAEALVVPSRREPFGIVTLEAAALARPVVLTAVCGVLELIDPALVTVVPADDAARLAAAILRLLSDPEEAWTQGQRLRVSLQDRAGWSRAAAELLSAASLS